MERLEYKIKSKDDELKDVHQQKTQVQEEMARNVHFNLCFPSWDAATTASASQEGNTTASTWS